MTATQNSPRPAAVAKAAERFRPALDAAAPAVARVRPVLAPVSRLGWFVLLASVGCWFVGREFGWIELMYMATASVVLFVACAVLTVGRTKLDVRVEVDPQRVRVGSPAAGRVVAVNTARAALLPVVLELPIGAGAARFQLPLLRPGGEHEELFVVPTNRRGVIEVGPALTVRGDPLGLLRRTVSWTEVLELFVHPVVVPLESLGAGLLRDLEGQTTQDVSMSDLAFHALRDYQPGDDRRYIHWRSSAKAGRFLVRQFLDTRRSHVTAVVDSAPSSYPDPDDYELAISAAASVTVRAVQDDQDVSVVAGDHAVPGAEGRRVLDTFSRAELGPYTLSDLTVTAARVAPETSIALLVTGSLTDYRDLQRAASHFPPEVRTVVLRVDPTAPTGIGGTTDLMVLSLQSLSELPALLAGALT